jgi:hypothetical protein
MAKDPIVEEVRRISEEYPAKIGRQRERQTSNL